MERIGVAAVERIGTKAGPPTQTPAQPATELFELRAAAEASKAKSKRGQRHKPVMVGKGSISVPIYGRGPYTVAWYEGDKRKRVMRSKFKRAKAFAEEKLKALKNGELSRLAMAPEDWAIYTRVREILLPTGKSPELAAAEYAESFEILRGLGIGIVEAARLAKQSRANIVPKHCPDIVTELLKLKEADEDIGIRWYDSLSSQLNRFAKFFSGPLPSLFAPDINTWLRSIPGGSRNRFNHRAAVLQLVKFAQASGYLSSQWNEMDRVPVPKVKDGEIRILTPEQLVKLLTVARPSLIPFLALTSFAGIRHQEMNGEKAELDWSNINFEKAIIYVPKGVGKTGNDRVVPMQPNLVAWLKPYARRNGKVCKLANTADPLCKAKVKAGIPSAKLQTRNSLRKSFISYRLAVTKNVNQVAMESGNSVKKIRSNYLNPVSEDEGKRWFDIWPTNADVIQLRFDLR